MLTKPLTLIVMAQFSHLKDRMKDSIVKDFVRGRRRYFPLTNTGTDPDSQWKRFIEAFFIIFGREPKNDGEIGIAIFFRDLESYIEEFDGRFWVRTIVEV
jgi:hypothetical protein